MNILECTLDELRAVYQEKSVAFEVAKEELNQASNNLREWKRLDNLKASLGNVSADDIAKVIESITLSAGSIQSQEQVQL